MPNVLVGADEIARGKPDPEGYLTAAARLGVPPDTCVVIEDAPAGVDAARAAGMRVIGVTAAVGHERLAMADWTIPQIGALRVTVVADRRLDVDGRSA